MGKSKKQKKSDIAMRQVPEAVSLGGIIEDALLLLAKSHATPEPAAHGPVAPFRSLLERCEGLLSANDRRQEPMRVIHSFGGEVAAGAPLDGLPNLHWIDQDRLASDLPDMAGDLVTKARTAAAMALLDGLDARGKRLMVRADHRFGGSSASAPIAAPDLTRRTLGLVWVRHPLVTFLLARHKGLLPFRPANLEAFSGRYLAFLADMGDALVIGAEGAGSDPVGTARAMAHALDLPLPADERAAEGLDGHMQWHDDIGELVDTLRYGDGSPATEEPLDSPNYIRLCRTLGYDPASLPSMPSATVPARPGRLRPPPRTGASPIVNLIAAMTQITEAPGRPEGGLSAGALMSIIDSCLATPSEFYDQLDSHLPHLAPQEAALVLIGCAAHFSTRNQKVLALGLLAEAEDHIALDDRAVRLLASGFYAALGKADLALALLTADAFDGALKLDNPQQTSLLDVLNKLSPVQEQEQEHGHSLMLRMLKATPPKPIGRPRVLIEIGTTRERVPGQGSTEKLAAMCHTLGIQFITVDMDPRNSHGADRMFRRHNLPFRAVTAKGEDFLAEWSGPIDYCFLDAYDFDHGNHSDVRQGRYETYLGSRIADAQCHQMHLDCATSLVTKLSNDGVICFDDTWLDLEGAWTAKGKTAMPYLLAHGFDVIEAANRAALLVRKA